MDDEERTWDGEAKNRAGEETTDSFTDVVVLLTEVGGSGSRKVIHATTKSCRDARDPVVSV